MPIKPENKKLYPANWAEIRERIRQRAGDKCEKCRVKNHSFICRGKWYGNDVYQDDDGAIFSAVDGYHIGDNYGGDLEEPIRFIKVVCTVAHLDHNPENNDEKNLAFLCQKCHNNHDRKHRNQTRRDSHNIGQLYLFNN